MTNLRFLKHILTALAVLAALVFAGCDPHDNNTPEPEPEPPKPKAIPTLRVATGVGLPTSKEEYITASMTIEDHDAMYTETASETVVTEIRGRGNSTWSMPKKPWKLKLDKKQRLFGMSENKHWVLLANYADKTLLRNVTAFQISRLAGMSWAPMSVPVALYIDDIYQGHYTLTEQIRTGDERVEMTLAGADDNEGDAVTGGYLLCVDYKDLHPEHGEAPKEGFWTKGDWQWVSGSLPIAFDEPEAPTQAQKDYVWDYFKSIEAALESGSLDQIAALLDLESAVNYFFVSEITKNVDSDMRLSTYLAKPRGGKLYFPCVWDFDLALGNADYSNDYSNGYIPAGWVMRSGTWFKYLFRNQEFCDLVAARWSELKPRLAEIEPQVRQWAEQIDESQSRNFRRWPILGVYVWPNYNAESRTTYAEELEYMIDFFNQRVAWIDTQITAGRHKI